MSLKNALRSQIDQASNSVVTRGADMRSDGSSLAYAGATKGYMSTLISDSRRTPIKPKLVSNMSKDSLRKFSYQNQFSLNEHRFDLVTLPNIYSKNTKAPNIVADYSRQKASRGGFDSSLKKDSLADRSYTVNYNQVQKKAQQFSFVGKKHSEVAQAPPPEELEDKKESMMDRLLRRA